jgi:hypothetical protein
MQQIKQFLQQKVVKNEIIQNTYILIMLWFIRQTLSNHLELTFGEESYLA